MIKIEDSVPVPVKPESEMRVALEKLQPGQSFALPAARYGTLQSNSHMVKKRLGEGRAFAVRIVGDEARVWRIR